jgi:hypothetical protein
MERQEHTQLVAELETIGLTAVAYRRKADRGPRVVIQLYPSAGYNRESVNRFLVALREIVPLRMPKEDREDTREG